MGGERKKFPEFAPQPIKTAVMVVRSGTEKKTRAHWQSSINSPSLLNLYFAITRRMTLFAIVRLFLWKQFACHDAINTPAVAIEQSDCYIRFNPVPMTSTEIRSTYIKTVWCLDTS